MTTEQAAISSFTTYVHGQDAEILTAEEDWRVRLQLWARESVERATVMSAALRTWAASPMSDVELNDLLWDAEVVHGEAEPETIRAFLLADADIIDAELAR